MRELALIQCTWSASGRISHRVLHGQRNYGGRANSKDDLCRVLAPSLPLIIGHQLGVMRPSNGIILCSRALDFYIRGHHITYPIDSALSSATLKFIQTQAGIAITFHPKHRPEANDDCLEQGARQFVNNYIKHVNQHVGDEVFLATRIFSMLVVGSYVDLLENRLARHLLGPDLDKWAPEFSKFMTGVIHLVSEQFRADYMFGADRSRADGAFRKVALEHESQLKHLGREMGIIA